MFSHEQLVGVKCRVIHGFFAGQARNLGIGHPSAASNTIRARCATPDGPRRLLVTVR
jgi:hypothetical protein